jgi:hypothetical protein
MFCRVQSLADEAQRQASALDIGIDGQEGNGELAPAIFAAGLWMKFCRGLRKLSHERK